MKEIGIQTEEGLQLTVNFSRLALVYTDPVYWRANPSGLASGLYRFLYDCLTAKEGRAWLGIDRQENSARWLEGEDALNWLQETNSQLWTPIAVRLAQGMEAQEAFHLLTRRRATLFMDKQRFLSVYSKHMGGIFARLKELQEVLATSEEGKEGLETLNRQFLLLQPDVLEEIEGDYYISFYLDWSYADTLLFSPQLRISNYWFENLALAPPRDDSAFEPPPARSPEETARWLEDIFWKQIETAFRALRQQYDIGSSHVRIEQARWESAVFYYAEPNPLPLQPEQMLQEPFLPAVEQLARPVLGTHDVFGADVSGGLLWGNLLTIRREIRASEGIQAYYLVLPWRRLENANQTRASVESKLMFVADQWAFIEFVNGFHAYDTLTDIERWLPLISIWRASVDEISDTAQRLHQALRTANDQERERLFKLARELRSALAQIEPGILQLSNDVIVAGRKIRMAAENAQHHARSRITTRVIPPLRSLLDEVGQFFPFRKASEIADHVKHVVTELREVQERSEKAIETIFKEQEQEMKEREVLAKEREKESRERFNFIIAIVASVLAAGSLFEVLQPPTAEQPSNKVAESISSLLTWLWNHGIPQLISICLLLISLFMVFYILWKHLKRKPKPETPSASEAEFQEVRVCITEAWKRATRSIRLVHELNRFRLQFGSALSRMIQETVAADQIKDIQTWRQRDKELRERLEQLDTEATEQLCKVWKWLHQARENLQDMEDWMRWLHRLVHTVVVKVELLDGRPSSLGLIRTLCLLRYKSLDFLSGSVVSYFEFEQVLNAYGYSDEEVKLIDRLATQWRGLSAEDFAQRLKELGVDAAHTVKKERLIQEILMAQIQAQQPEEVEEELVRMISDDIAAVQDSEATLPLQQKLDDD